MLLVEGEKTQGEEEPSKTRRETVKALKELATRGGKLGEDIKFHLASFAVDYLMVDKGVFNSDLYLTRCGLSEASSVFGVNKYGEKVCIASRPLALVPPIGYSGLVVRYGIAKEEILQWQERIDAEIAATMLVSENTK